MLNTPTDAPTNTPIHAATGRQSNAAPEVATRETIVLLHGLAAHGWTMQPLARRLARPGTRLVNWSYQSLRGTVSDHADRLARTLHDQLQPLAAGGPIHFVTHSMGCIVTRAALSRYRPKSLGRWVMLAPPNHGSHVASGPLGRWFGRWIPAVQELSDDASSYVCNLPCPNSIDIGVIAARHDWLVRPESTRIPQQHDYVTVNSWHSGLLFQRSVSQLVRSFLDVGSFNQPSQTDAPHDRVSSSVNHPAAQAAGP
ncbi:MAG: alpha/beta fold hydrolase [Pirellulales bacterium]